MAIVLTMTTEKDKTLWIVQIHETSFTRRSKCAGNRINEIAVIMVPEENL